jgi:uncharacterized protein (TIGR00297 family)
MKILLSVLPNAGLGLAGVLLGAFDIPAALLGLAAGSLLTYAFGIGGFLVLLAFVALGCVTTKIGYGRKAEKGIGEPEGGRRTWRSAVANLVIPAAGACAAIAWPRSPGGLFAVGSIATAAFDTVASEMGKAFAGKTLTLHDMKIRPAGTAGGISLVGTLSGGAATLVVSFVALGFGLLRPGMVVWVLAAAMAGTAIESLLRSGAGVRSTHAANIVNTAAGGAISVLLVSAAKVT